MYEICKKLKILSECRTFLKYDSVFFFVETNVDTVILRNLDKIFEISVFICKFEKNKKKSIFPCADY